MLPFFAWKIFSISFFISLDFYLQVFLKNSFVCKIYMLCLSEYYCSISCSSCQSIEPDSIVKFFMSFIANNLI